MSLDNYIEINPYKQRKIKHFPAGAEKLESSKYSYACCICTKHFNKGFGIALTERNILKIWYVCSMKCLELKLKNLDSKSK